MSRNADPRALAAQALARVVAGESLRTVFAAFSTTIRDARDRALLSALLHAGARWWLRFDAALRDLLERPLQGRAPALHALLVLGLVQIEILQLPAYAAVAATVDAAKTLGQIRFAGLVNAVLRRWLREREARNAALDRDEITRSAHPRWLIDVLRADWPHDVQTILAGDNAEAPLTLRVNRRRAARAALLERLIDAGVPATAHPLLADALVLDESADIAALPGYAEGWFSVQDGAAQLAADLLEARDGMRVLDACAAPGGKCAHVLERAAVEVVALDRDARRLALVAGNLERLRLAAILRHGDAAAPATWWDGRQFDRILLDAPCSATGVIRRQPDIKLHRRAADIPALAGVQTGLLDALWPLLRPGGRLVYATCSLLAAENSGQIDAFLQRQPDGVAVPILPNWHRAGVGAQNLPGDGGMDGFFYAVVEKRA